MVAEELFHNFANKTMGAANAETNAGTHTMLRARHGGRGG